MAPLSVLAVTLSLSGAAHEGATPVPQIPAPPSDSAQLVALAHRAQGAFERDRLRWLDPVQDDGGGGCDETVGRICLLLKERSDWWPSPDPPQLARARERLLTVLAEAAEVAPGDGWLLGQRVVYLGEAGRWSEAFGLARRCGDVARWWCDALAGTALHRLGRYREAEASFRDALRAMPAEDRERWTEVEPLLDRDGASEYAEAQDRTREANGDAAGVQRRWWALADPLFLVPGNDRLTEHWARHTVAGTREGARNPYATSWGWDLEEVLIRYGVEVGWSRQLPGLGSVGRRTTGLGQHHPRSRSFLPPPEAWTDPAATDATAWNPGSRRAPAAMYAPAYAPVFLPTPAQISVSRRGDEIVVRAGFALPEDTTWHSRHDHPALPLPEQLHDSGYRRGLFLVPVEPGLAGDTMLSVTSRDPTEGVLSLTAPAGDWVVSVEVWDPARGLAGRRREGLRSPAIPVDVPSLSGLMLAPATGPIPDSLEVFLRQLGRTPALTPGATVRVAWELSGLGWHGPEELRYRLELRGDDGNVLTRVGRWLRLVGDPDGVGVRWQEPGPPRPVPVFRAVDLELPAGLGEGRYTLRLTLIAGARTPLVSERTVELRRDG